MEMKLGRCEWVPDQLTTRTLWEDPLYQLGSKLTSIYQNLSWRRRHKCFPVSGRAAPQNLSCYGVLSITDGRDGRDLCCVAPFICGSQGWLCLGQEAEGPESWGDFLRARWFLPVSCGLWCGRGSGFGTWAANCPCDCCANSVLLAVMQAGMTGRWVSGCGVHWELAGTARAKKEVRFWTIKPLN